MSVVPLTSWRFTTSASLTTSTTVVLLTVSVVVAGVAGVVVAVSSADTAVPAKIVARATEAIAYENESVFPLIHLRNQKHSISSKKS